MREPSNPSEAAQAELAEMWRINRTVGGPTSSHKPTPSKRKPEWKPILIGVLSFFLLSFAAYQVYWYFGGGKTANDRIKALERAKKMNIGMPKIGVDK